MSKKYKFGFLGLSGSGKTCIITALNMQRREHPSGYTCALLPLDVAPPPMDEKETWTDAEKEAYNLHNSYQRLEESKQQLENGSVPVATELTTDLIFDFEFSSKETGSVQVRLIDYAGELASPEGYIEEKTVLRDKLAGMDGLFIIAPAPNPNKPDKEKSEFLHLLQNTLTRISFNQPIVLLVNKWDRIAPLPEYTSSIEALTPDKLPSTEHRDLYNALVAKVGKENCKAFPVSAFGECELRTSANGKTFEFPKQVNPLASFGLLEGFIWMAQRLKIILLESYEQDVASYKKWIPFPSLHLRKLKAKGNEIIGIFPKKSELAERARQAQSKFSKIWLTRFISLSVLMVIIPLLVFAVKQAYDDNKQYNEFHSILNNPQAKLEQIINAEQWLENYYSTKPLLHPFSWLFVVSNNSAKSELDKSRQERDESLWQAIQDAPSIQHKLQECKKYSKSLPNGKHITDVNTIIAKLETEERNEREKQWWQFVETAQSPQEKIETAKAYLQNLPKGVHAIEAERVIKRAEKEIRLAKEKARDEETKRVAKEKRWWQPVIDAQSPKAKIEAAQAYLQNISKGKHEIEAISVITKAQEELRVDKRWWQAVVDAKSPQEKIETAKAYLEKLPTGEHSIEAQRAIKRAKETIRLAKEEETKRVAKEKRWWQPVIDAQSPQAKIATAQAYLQNIDKGKHEIEAISVITKAKEELRVEKELWQPVMEAKSPRELIKKAQIYLQAKPNGLHAAKAKILIAQAETALHDQKEQRWWLPVEQAGSLEIKAEKAEAYLKELPNGKHAAEASVIITQAESETNWIAFKADYYNWFNNGYFLEAAQILSQHQDNEKLQALKQHFSNNVINSLTTKINGLIKHRKWSNAYKELDKYDSWPSEFKTVEKGAQIRALIKTVQVAEDRLLYTEFLENRDLERAENYLKYAPLQTMQKHVKEYKNYLVKMQNTIGLTLYLDRIEWGDINANDNTITVFINGKKVIETDEGIDADSYTSTGEIGHCYLARKLSDFVTIEVKIVKNNWLFDNYDNGQGRKKVKVANLNGFSLVLKPEGKETPKSKAVFRLHGIPRKPSLPSWEEN